MHKILLSLFLITGMTSGAWAACTIDQRIDLSKAGYDKNEIDQLCAAAGDTASGGTVPTQVSDKPALPTGIALLNQGAFLGGNAADHAKRRCVVSEAGVTLPKKGLVGFDQLVVDPVNKIDRGDQEILLVLSLSSGFNSEWCILMRVDTWKYKNNPAAFNADVERYEGEYNAMIAELKQRNMRFKR